MSNGKKNIVSIIIIFAVFGAGILTGVFIQKATDSKLAARHLQTALELGRTVAELQDLNNGITASHNRLEKTVAELREQLGNIVLRIGEAEGIISEIESGVSNSSITVQRIIKSITSVIKAVIQLEETE